MLLGVPSDGELRMRQTAPSFTGRRTIFEICWDSVDRPCSRACTLPLAMPQLEVGHLDRMAPIDRRLTLPGLLVSASGFRGVGRPDCITDVTPWPSGRPDTSSLHSNAPGAIVRRPSVRILSSSGKSGPACPRPLTLQGLVHRHQRPAFRGVGDENHLARPDAQTLLE